MKRPAVVRRGSRKRPAKITKPYRPTPVDLQNARDKSVPDLIARDLHVLFVGINPGLYSAAVRHHFARPGNRFWPVLHRSGFTPRQLSPFEERSLLRFGLGVTNFVNRATATAAELKREELIGGGVRLVDTVRRWRPRVVAVLGVGAYRMGFQRPRARIGRQTETLGSSLLWVLPNPSGLNANYQIDDLTKIFRTLRASAVTGGQRTGKSFRRKRKILDGFAKGTPVG